MLLTAHYPATCDRCHGPINAGTRVEWDRATRRIEHVTCPPRVRPSVRPSVPPTQGAP